MAGPQRMRVKPTRGSGGSNVRSGRRLRRTAAAVSRIRPRLASPEAKARLILGEDLGCRGRREFIVRRARLRCLKGLSSVRSARSGSRPLRTIGELLDGPLASREQYEHVDVHPLGRFRLVRPKHDRPHHQQLAVGRDCAADVLQDPDDSPDARRMIGRTLGRSRACRT